jgi:hypothetical protein
MIFAMKNTPSYAKACDNTRVKQQQQQQQQQRQQQHGTSTIIIPRRRNIEMTAVTAYDLQMYTIPSNTTLYYFFQCYGFLSKTITIRRSVQTLKNQG